MITRILKNSSVHFFIILILIFAVFFQGISLHQQREAHPAVAVETPEAVQRLTTEEIEDAIAENERLTQANMALQDADKNIVNSYMRNIIDALYTENGEPYMDKIMAIKELMSEQMYNSLTMNLFEEEYNDAGVRTSVEIQKIYTNRPSDTTMEALAVCKYSDSTSNDIYTLLLGMDFTYIAEKDRWIMTRFPLEKYVVGYQDDYY